MSTKQNPGKFDCYAKLADDEPFFVLRAKDPIAPALVDLWATEREIRFGDYEKLAEARQVALDMRTWRLHHPTEKTFEQKNGMAVNLPPLPGCQPCGCDPAANHICDVHRAQYPPRRVKLYTASGGFVHEQEILPFNEPPDTVIWGIRIFAKRPHSLKIDPESGEHSWDYIEGFAYALVPMTRGSSAR